MEQRKAALAHFLLLLLLPLSRQRLSCVFRSQISLNQLSS